MQRRRWPPGSVLGRRAIVVGGDHAMKRWSGALWRDHGGAGRLDVFIANAGTGPARCAARGVPASRWSKPCGPTSMGLPPARGARRDATRWINGAGIEPAGQRGEAFHADYGDQGRADRSPSRFDQCARISVVLRRLDRHRAAAGCSEYREGSSRPFRWAASPARTMWPGPYSSSRARWPATSRARSST
jgi:hypothetical protein